MTASFRPSAARAGIEFADETTGFWLPTFAGMTNLFLLRFCRGLLGGFLCRLLGCFWLGGALGLGGG